SDPKVTEAYLEQPQGNVVLVKQAAEKYAGPMTVEDLMKKQLEALGGEANLRRHRSLALKTRQVFEDQGITATSSEWFEAPARHAELQTLYAAGKRIATSHDYCDGKQAGGETTFSLPEIKTGNKLSDEIVDADPWPALDWKSLFKT